MMRLGLAACVSLSLVACGPKVPTHPGVKTNKPWNKAEPLAFDADLLAKFDGKLNYAKYRRVKWFTVDVPERANLTVDLAYAPTDEAGESTVALEILGPNLAVISPDPEAPLDEDPADRASNEDDGDDGDDEEDEEDDDEDSGDDDGEGNTQKTRSIEVKPGTYMVHIFLLGRTDEADYELTVRYTPLEPEYASNFPNDVRFLPPMPTVPVADDTEVAIVKDDPPPKKCKGKKCKKEPKVVHKEPKEKEPKEVPEPKGKVTGSIVASSADGSGSEIVINVGASDCVSSGDKGRISGLGDKGGFTVTSCTNKSCRAKAPKATLEMVKSAKSISVSPSKPCG